MLSMETGERHRSRSREWTAGYGEAVPAKETERVCLGSHAVDAIEFIEVGRDNGSKHLIAIETIHLPKPV